MLIGQCWFIVLIWDKVGYPPMHGIWVWKHGKVTSFTNDFSPPESPWFCQWVAELLGECRKPIGRVCFFRIFPNITEVAHLFNSTNPTVFSQAMCWPNSHAEFATKRVRHLLRSLQILWEALGASSKFPPQIGKTPMFGKTHHNLSVDICSWLVVECATPLKNDGVRQLGWLYIHDYSQYIMEK